MTVYVPTSVASVTMYDNAGLVDHTHTPGDRPDLDGAEDWAIKCSPVCERAVVAGFDAWRDGDATTTQGDDRVDVYAYGVTVSPDEIDVGDDDPPPPAGPAGIPVFNVTLPSITVNAKHKRPKRQKRTRVTVEAAPTPNVTVQPQITVAQPPVGPRRTSVRRRKDGTMVVESEPSPTNTDRGGPK